MNRDDIIRMAWDAHLLDMSRHPLDYLEIDDLERFANLVAAAEREACAKVCEQHICTCWWDDDAQAYVAKTLANTLRARSQQ